MKWILVLVILAALIITTFLEWRYQNKRRKAIGEIIDRGLERAALLKERLKQEAKINKNSASSIRDLIERNDKLFVENLKLKKQLKESNEKKELFF